MDVDSGVFTAPATGAYYFTFSGVAGGIKTKVQLNLNGAVVGSAFGSGKTMALVRIIDLQKGDAITLELVPGGSLLADYGATFTCRLLPSNSIYFDVGRNSDFENPRVFDEKGQVINDTDSKIIPFHSSSGGGGMDAPKGVFTTPVDGAYHFAFSGLADEKNEFVRVRLTARLKGHFITGVDRRIKQRRSRQTPTGPRIPSRRSLQFIHPFHRLSHRRRVVREP